MMAGSPDWFIILVFVHRGMLTRHGLLADSSVQYRISPHIRYITGAVLHIVKRSISRGERYDSERDDSDETEELPELLKEVFSLNDITASRGLWEKTPLIKHCKNQEQLYFHVLYLSMFLADNT